MRHDNILPTRIDKMPGIKRKSLKSVPSETTSRSKKLKVDKAPTKRSAKPDSNDETDTSDDDLDTSAPESNAANEDVEMKEPRHERRGEGDSKPKKTGNFADGQKSSALANMNCMRSANRFLSWTEKVLTGASYILPRSPRQAESTRQRTESCKAER
jgi:hypothetical protein